ncbi:MAG: LicD family protein, partial [Alistipes sp.]|nr:LicD family protein [Alistipes sp.]
QTIIGYMIDNEALKQRYNPEGSKLRANQKELLEILVDLAKICDDNNIEWWLSSGTLLGAARHGGFIPWDDDIDIVMTRKEVKRLEKILHKLDSEKYVYQTIHSDIEYTNVFGKFRKRNDTVSIYGGRYKYLTYKGKFIDIFSIEKTSLFAARAAKIIYRNLQHLSIYVKTKWLRHLTTRVIQILCLGIIIPIIRLIGKINPKGEYHYTLGTGWQKSTFFAKDIFPLSKAKFEGYEFPVPKDMDAYLRGVYGDWSKIPSEEQIRASIHCVEYREEIYGEK